MRSANGESRKLLSRLDATLEQLAADAKKRDEADIARDAQVCCDINMIFVKITLKHRLAAQLAQLAQLAADAKKRDEATIARDAQVCYDIN